MKMNAQKQFSEALKLQTRKSRKTTYLKIPITLYNIEVVTSYFSQYNMIFTPTK